jgi:hypothetical protein
MPTTSTATDLANIPIPAGAVRVFDWQMPAVSGHPEPLRYFDGITRVVDRVNSRGDDVEVIIEGTQHSDGQVERAIRVSHIDPDFPMLLERVEELSKAFAAAADEAKTLSSYDQICEAQR